MCLCFFGYPVCIFVLVTRETQRNTTHFEACHGQAQRVRGSRSKLTSKIKPESIAMGSRLFGIGEVRHGKEQAECANVLNFLQVPRVNLTSTSFANRCLCTGFTTSLWTRKSSTGELRFVFIQASGRRLIMLFFCRHVESNNPSRKPRLPWAGLSWFPFEIDPVL